MLSYLMVIMRLKKLKNGLQTDAQIKTWLTWSKKKSNKGNTVCCQCWSPRYKISLLSPKWQGCHPKGLTVTWSYKTKQILIIVKIIIISNFNMPVPISLFARQEKKINRNCLQSFNLNLHESGAYKYWDVFLRLVL